MADTRTALSCLFGIFVGGASRRMGQDKGLLPPPDGSAPTLVERLARVSHEAGAADVILVGGRASYAGLGLIAIDDRKPNSGPLGGLTALLAEAKRRGLNHAVAVGCDFPRLSAPLLGRLTQFSPEAAVVAPWLDGRFQPLCARYHVKLLPECEARLHRQHLSLQPFLHQATTHRLPLDDDELPQLTDWDRPEDVDP